MVGIDKIMMTTKDFRIGNSGMFKNSITYSPEVNGDLQPLKVWAQDKRGNAITGKLFNQLRDVVIDINDKGMRLVFNPSVISAKGRVNHLANNRKDMAMVNEIVQGVCNELQIDTCVKTHTLHRIDLAKDCTMNMPVEEYFPVLSALDGKRMKVVGYPDGHSFRNGQREGMFYNRGLKVQMDTGKQMENSLARFEFRAKNKIEVCKRLKVGQWNQLIDCEQEHISLVYREFLTADIFRIKHAANEIALLPTIEAEIIKTMSWKKYRNMTADLWQIENYGGIEAVNKTMELSGVSKSARYRYLENMRESIQLAKFLESKRGRGKMNRLYEELFNKFVA
jgi:hypothetical protein